MATDTDYRKFKSHVDNAVVGVVLEAHSKTPVPSLRLANSFCGIARDPFG